MAKKTTKKDTKKTKSPEILVNCFDVETPNDIYAETIQAKIRAKKAITEEELDWYAISTVNKALELVIPTTVLSVGAAMCSACCKKKEPWYKRAWKKIKGLFKKK